MKDILGTTYGLIVYQEQVMQIAQKLAGYSLGQTDILRKAMGKEEGSSGSTVQGLPAGMLDNGYSEESIKALWDVVVPFSAYTHSIRLTLQPTVWCRIGLPTLKQTIPPSTWPLF